jgi:hypothetical protein
MTPKLQLQTILGNKYLSEDGDPYEVELMEGMTQVELENFKGKLPNKNLPADIADLLTFSKGFGFHALDEIRFDNFQTFGFNEIFPYSIELAGDGFGNFWILDIDSIGN